MLRLSKALLTCLYVTLSICMSFGVLSISSGSPSTPWLISHKTSLLMAACTTKSHLQIFIWLSMSSIWNTSRGTSPSSLSNVPMLSLILFTLKSRSSFTWLAMLASKEGPELKANNFHQFQDCTTKYTAKTRTQERLLARTFKVQFSQSCSRVIIPLFPRC